MNPNAIWLHALLACLSFAIAPLALAQTYPTRAVRLIVPFPPGGAEPFARGSVFAVASGRLVTLTDAPGLGVEPDLVKLAPYLTAH